jgi:hypothetical protein
MFKPKSAAGLSLVLFTAAFVACPSSASAGEKGKFQGHAVLEGTKFTEYKAIEGHPLKSMWVGELDGLIFYTSGTSQLDRMLDRAHYFIVSVGDGAGNSYCAKTFTTKDGSKLYLRCEGKANPTGATGTVTILGGTGPFSGMKGKGKFNFVTVTDRVFWDDIEWDWETP